jgi:hypothetical protein
MLTSGSKDPSSTIWLCYPRAKSVRAASTCGCEPQERDVPLDQGEKQLEPTLHGLAVKAIPEAAWVRKGATAKVIGQS